MSESYFAEFGTDKFIRETFFPDISYQGVMVEVGAATPEFLSMSQHFRLSGWRCIGIEPNPKYVEMHQKRGNEIHAFACSDEDKDDQDFEIVHTGENYEGAEITDHSFSALKVVDEYKRMHAHYDSLKVIKAKVNVRKLDTILESLGVEHVDLVAVDVEGWELAVMRGFNTKKYKPKVVVLENYLHKNEYVQYMSGLGYVLSTRIEYNYIFKRGI